MIGTSTVFKSRELSGDLAAFMSGQQATQLTSVWTCISLWLTSRSRPSCSDIHALFPDWHPRTPDLASPNPQRDTLARMITQLLRVDGYVVKKRASSFWKTAWKVTRSFSYRRDSTTSSSSSQWHISTRTWKNAPTESSNQNSFQINIARATNINCAMNTWRAWTGRDHHASSLVPVSIVLA